MYYTYLMISATEYSFEEMCSARVNRAKGKCLGPNEFSFTFFYAIPKSSCCFCPMSWVGLEFLELAKRGSLNGKDKCELLFYLSVLSSDQNGLKRSLSSHRIHHSEARREGLR